MNDDTLLDDLHAFFRKYVAFPSPEALDAVCLWAAHTHVYEAFESSPRLALISAEKQSGKTRTLELLEIVCRAPLFAFNVSVSAIVRTVNAEATTLLFDEADAVFGALTGAHHEDLRALVNAGHRRGAVFLRAVGPQHEPTRFNANSAVALAGIGALPDTIMDRAVVVRMRRRLATDPVQPLRRKAGLAEGAPLKDRFTAWAEEQRESLSTAEPEMPPGVHDRSADVWEALLAIADAVGAAWPDRARQAAVRLLRESRDEDDSPGVALLNDCREAFGEKDRLSSQDLLGRLVKLDRQRGRDGRRRDLNVNGLAHLLRPYDIRPRSIRIGDETPKGYYRRAFEDAWDRYLPADATSATPPQE